MEHWRPYHIISFVLYALFIPLFVVWVIGFFAPFFWLADIAVNFTTQYAIGFGCLLVLSACWVPDMEKYLTGNVARRLQGKDAEKGSATTGD